MAKPFDYSKWDKIELSDDEDDVHPNIDKDSWFRWKHQARVEREEKEKRERADLDEKNKLANAQKAELLGKLRTLEEGVEDATTAAEVAGVRAELAELEAGLVARNARLEEMERNRKLNVDNIGTVVKDFTSINRREAAPDVLPDSLDLAGKATISSTNEKDEKPAAAAAKPSSSSSSASSGITSTSAGGSSSSAAASAGAKPAKKEAAPAAASAAVGPASELDAVESYNNFAITHEKLLEDFSELTSLEQTKEVLHEKGHILLAEHAQSYLLLSCLEDEMNGKHDRMKNTARQSQILTHISELAVSLGRSPRDVVIPFFRRLEQTEHLKGFNEAVKDFIAKVQKRAVDKRREMEEARRRGEPVEGLEEVELDEEARLGPGGLDPVKVFEGLPRALQEAFESRDMEKLHAALAAMPVEEAKKHMKDCEDSGLWVPSRSSDEGAEAEQAAAGGGDEEEEDD